jgi:ribose-phosphate pyrophosphokinase
MKSFILSGSSSRHLAENIGIKNNLPVLENRVVRFINAEMKVTLPDQVKDYDKCYIVQTASNPANDNLFELLFTADTLKREGVKEIGAIIPYFGYSRQDKQHLPFECVSSEVVVKLLEKVGVQKVYTVDIHNEKTMYSLDIPVTKLSSMPVLAKKVYDDLVLDETKEKDFTIASPDQGGIIRAELFAKNFYKNSNNIEFVSIKKERELDKQHLSQAIEMRGEIKDKNVIIVDDVSTSGSTLLNAMKLCMANNKVRNIYAVIVHPDFGFGVLERIRNSEIEKIYVSNTIEKTLESLSYYKKVKIFDISEVFLKI